MSIPGLVFFWIVSLKVWGSPLKVHWDSRSPAVTLCSVYVGVGVDDSSYVELATLGISDAGSFLEETDSPVPNAHT
jgi:hypothetical protein